MIVCSGFNECLQKVAVGYLMQGLTAAGGVRDVMMV